MGYGDFAQSADDNLVITGESKQIEAAYPLHGSIQNFSRIRIAIGLACSRRAGR